MDFWTWLGYILSFVNELLFIHLFDVSIPGTEVVAYVNVGEVIIIGLLIGIVLHLLVPSAKGV